jgi:hypothetical protein
MSAKLRLTSRCCQPLAEFGFRHSGDIVSQKARRGNGLKGYMNLAILILLHLDKDLIWMNSLQPFSEIVVTH